jgi:hypothetical protein
LYAIPIVLVVFQPVYVIVASWIPGTRSSGVVFGYDPEGAFGAPRIQPVAR